MSVVLVSVVLVSVVCCLLSAVCCDAGYIVNVSSLDASVPGSARQLLNVSTESVQVSNLTTSTTYACTISAWNTVGVSVASVVVYGTPAHPPPQPATAVHGASVSPSR